MLVIVGLAAFLEGLRTFFYPLGELVGELLPYRLSLIGMLIVCGILGILVTYAEPAISSIAPLAHLVSKHDTPYLFLLLNELREVTVFMIAFGVGVSAVVGALRFRYRWSMLSVILVSVLPTMALSAYLQWGGAALERNVGMAWDCGAMTTGT